MYFNKKVKNSILEQVSFILIKLAKLNNVLSLKIENGNIQFPLWDNDWVITKIASQSFEIYTPSYLEEMFTRI